MKNSVAVLGPAWMQAQQILITPGVKPSYGLAMTSYEQLWPAMSSYEQLEKPSLSREALGQGGKKANTQSFFESFICKSVQIKMCYFTAVTNAVHISSQVSHNPDEIFIPKVPKSTAPYLS